MDKVVKSQLNFTFDDKGNLKVDQIETEVDDARDQHIHKSRQVYEIGMSDDEDRNKAVIMTKQQLLATVALFLNLPKDQARQAFI